MLWSIDANEKIVYRVYIKTTSTLLQIRGYSTTDFTVAGNLKAKVKVYRGYHNQMAEYNGKRLYFSLLKRAESTDSNQQRPYILTFDSATLTDNKNT